MRSLLSALAASGLALAFVAAARADDRKRDDERNTEVARGRVTRVDPTAGRITVSTRGGKEMEFRVDDASRLEQDGRNARLGDFKEGARVRVTYARRGGENRVVRLAPALVGNGEVRSAVRDALREGRGFAFRQKDELRRRMDEHLRELDDRIDDLQERADAAGAEGRRKYRETLEDLQRRRDAARAKIDRLRGASADSYEDLKSGALDALNDLQRAYDDARSRIPAAGRDRP